MYSTEELRIRSLSIPELKVGRLYAFQSRYDGLDRTRLAPNPDGHGPRDHLNDDDTVVVLNVDEHMNSNNETFIRVHVLSQFGPRWMFYKVSMIRHAPKTFRELA